MTEELFLKGAIKDCLDQARLLRAQTVVDAKAIDDNLWHALGLAIDLDELYAKQIKEIDGREVITIKDELFKRQEMAELSNHREEAITTMFNRNNPDENNLAELFEDMRRQTYYETAFYQSDVKLVQEQLDAVKDADDTVANLKAEKQDVENRIEAIKNSMVSFDEFNRNLNEDYTRFISENHTNDINVEEAMRERARRLERQAVINRNRQLIKTAQNINPNDYMYANFLSENEIALHDANEKLFLYEVGNLCKAEVNSYEELYDKTRKLHEYISDREASSSQVYDIDRPNEISYRTIAFAMDVNNVENQLKAPSRIADLEEQIHEIDLKIENAYDSVKGRRLIDDIINNRKEEYAKAGSIAQEVEIPNDVEPVAIAPVNNTVDNKTIDPIAVVPIINNVAPDNKTPGIVNDNNVVDNNPQQAIVPVNNQSTALVPLKDGEFEVKKISKAKPSLLARIKEKYKDKLILLGKLAAAAILAGAILFGTIGSVNIMNEKNRQQAAVVPNQIVTEQAVDLEANEISPEIADAINQAAEVYSPTIGDKVHVDEGVKYYRDSTVAQLDQNSYETGKSGLKEGNYNVNRIALLAKDATGKPTGQIIDVNTNPGVSASEIAKSLGLAEGSYDVIMHIGSGDATGNYLEANRDSQSPDDLCWIKTDGTYVNGLSLTKAASEVLNINAEKGMSK